MPRAASFILALGFLLVVPSCTFSPEKLEFERGEKAAQAGHSEEAVQHYRAVTERATNVTPLSLKAAQEAARISHFELKHYPEAISFYRYIILNAANGADRITAQKQIADIYFSQTLNYSQAVIEYSRLLELPHTAEEEATYRMSIARSYFYLSNFFQAQTEIDRILAGKFAKQMQFDARVLKANIFLTTKQLDEAIKVLHDLIVQDPERAKAETIGLILAICYEEQKNFAKAIETLESIKQDYPKRDFIENKIRTLRERQSYLPGAKGLKK